MSYNSKDFTIEDWEKWKLCQSYVYCGKEALSKGKTILWSLVLVFGCGIVGFIIDYVTADEFQMYWLIAGLTIGMISMFVLVLYERQYLVMKALKQYFRDEEGVFWSITLTEAASIAVPPSIDGSILSYRWQMKALDRKANLLSVELSEAKSSRNAYMYVKRAKQGIKDWNWFDGGPAKVRCFNELTLVKEGRKKSKYTYLNKRGKVKKITIPNEYGGLMEATRK